MFWGRIIIIVYDLFVSLKAEDAEKAKNDLSEFAEEAKSTGASMFDHAKGAATAAIAAGSKAAEDIADEKLKEAESVSFDNLLFKTISMSQLNIYLKIKIVSCFHFLRIQAFDQKLKEAEAYADATREDLEKV